jgi:hypothetical protein
MLSKKEFIFSYQILIYVLVPGYLKTAHINTANVRRSQLP